MVFAVINPTVPTIGPGKCPSGCQWTEYASMCYYSETSKMLSFNDAQEDCVRRAGRKARLVTISDAEISWFIVDELQKLEIGSYWKGFWIGLARRNVG